MPYIAKITTEKARKLNNTASIYGTFAEIGAGQEVVNHFFKAGQASKTVAKSMSAYDMTFSSAIYGKAQRYVSKKRLLTMLDHEYTLLEKRLKGKKGHDTQFFAFADTVATCATGRSHESQQHGWMGIRFQNTYGSACNEIILHINLLDNTRLQQHETLGALGVNLIHSAFYGKKDCRSIINSLFDNLEPNRVDVDVLNCSGKIFNKFNHHNMNMELIRQKSTSALLFQDNGPSLLPSDVLYEQPILIYQENLNNKERNIKKALSYINKGLKKNQSLKTLLNIPFSCLKKNKSLSSYLKKYQPSAQGLYQYILISDFEQLPALKNFIRKATDQHIFLLLDPKSLVRIAQTSQKKSIDMLAFFSQLCDAKTVLLLFGEHSTQKSGPLFTLQNYLKQTGQMVHLK